MTTDRPTAIIRDRVIRAVVTKACDCVKWSASVGEGATVSLSIDGEVVLEFGGQPRHALRCSACGAYWRPE